MTEYIIFVKASEEWLEVGMELARSTRSALRQYLATTTDEKDGQFVAVPARSWQPVTVKTETKTALKFS